MTTVPKLDGVHPVLAEKITKVLVAMFDLGFPMVITAGLRTAEQQHALWQKGRDEQGEIVTYADGYLKKSNHQEREDGYGHAVDLAFLVGKQPSWAETHPWALYGLMVKSQGLVWGGDWKMRDRPHAELP
jgi:peptidoglycan L-alanyl-D-glutamate endopeptidase CwlK